MSLDHPARQSRIEPVATTRPRSMVPSAIAIVSTRIDEEYALGRLEHRGRAAARRMRRPRRPTMILVLAAWAILCAAGDASATLRFRADEWVTECGGSLGSPAADCSITVPFWQTGSDGKGSFALVVMLETGNIGIVGQPVPVKAVLRVDGNPPIECRAAQYCIFPTAPISLCRQGARDRLAGPHRCLYDASPFRLQPDAKGLPGRSGADTSWGYRLRGD